MHSWGVSDVLAVFLVLVVIIGVALMLALVVRCDDQLEQDRPLQVRSQLFLLAAVALGVLTLVAQRFELGHAVKQLME